MGPDVYIFRNATRTLVPARRVHRPRAFWSRTLGLLARPPLNPEEGLWLDPCGGIHTWGLREAIDVLFLDREQRVLAVVPNLRPWRLAWAPRGTRSVVELPSGSARGTRPGDRLSFEEIR